MMYELFDEETARKQYDTARSIQDVEKTKVEVALNMLAKGKLSIEEIAEYSGLALAKIKELATGTSS